MQDRLRRLPKVQAVLDSDFATRLVQAYGYEEVANAVRARIQNARNQIRSGDEPGMPDLDESEMLTGIEAALSAARISSLQPVINATGIIIHTNLGRARLAPEAMAAMQEVAESYSTLELDLETGRRGSRHSHVENLICQLTGAEAAMAVNNCAAAILTSLTALGSGKPIVASRGEMVEIGGAFRMPDVIAQSGANLREVGTTNKTHLRDYAQAICDDTALLLKSHTSNYAVVGFSSVPTRQDLAALARERGVWLVEDLGSGVLVDLSPFGLPDEPVVRDVLASGVDVVTFSGDKLLGGPQAGIIAGRRTCLDKIKTHPLARAVRIDKLSLAALNATLELYRAPNNPFDRIPVLQVLAEPIDAIEARAAGLRERLKGRSELKMQIIATKARAGGGTLPQQDLPSFAVSLALADCSPDSIAKRLRAAKIPVLGRISNNQYLLDMRAVAESELEQLAASVLDAILR